MKKRVKMIDIQQPAPASEKAAREVEIKPSPQPQVQVLRDEHAVHREPKFHRPKINILVEDRVERFEVEEKKRFGAQRVMLRERNRTAQMLLWVGATLILLLAIYLAVAVLPRAEITIVTKKAPFSFTDSVVASTEVSATDVSARKISAELFSEQRNFTFSRAATGKTQVEEFARGTITIYNNYSSDTLTLSKNTRFETPDKKVFFLDRRIIVPGAKVAQGNIVASSIEARVVAEKPGVEYNIGPVERFTIPGLRGTPRYDGFYGVSSKAMAGGLVGEKTYATESDKAQMREEGIRDLRDTIDSYLSLQLPNGFMVPEGAKEFVILQERLNEEVDALGNFTLFLEAKSTLLAFKESDLISLLDSLGQQALGNEYTLLDYEKLEYGAGRANFNQGQVSFAVELKGTFQQPINPDVIMKSIAKMDETNLKTYIYSLPEIERATVSFWPFWVGRVPEDASKIRIEVQ